ncbi:MAG: type II secretion system protein [Campylobacterota bacterium]|nr:type II secretion system protein [Campylobacterota bacterium]
MKRKNAFSMIELILVIVVMGILASLAIPRMDRDLRQEAIDSITSDIMLTQRMALSDHRHDSSDPQWQRTYWQWQYMNTADCSESVVYSVFSDLDKDGDANNSEIAIDSYNHKYIHAPDSYCSSGTMPNDYSERVLLTKKFGIDSISSTGGCSSTQQIAFDELGRPHVGISGSTTPNFASLMQTDCTLTFTFDNGLIDDTDDFNITIEAITGRICNGSIKR